MMAATRQVRDPAGLYRRVEQTAVDPPGGIPERWGFVELHVTGSFRPDEGEWWHAAAEYVRTDQLSGTRRLIGAGPTVHAALRALELRLAEPLEERQQHARGGWDTNWQPGRVEQDS